MFLPQIIETVIVEKTAKIIVAVNTCEKKKNDIYLMPLQIHIHPPSKSDCEKLPLLINIFWDNLEIKS